MYNKMYMYGDIPWTPLPIRLPEPTLHARWTVYATTTKPSSSPATGEQSVVLLSLEDYKALEETAYLLRTPENAKRILAATTQLNAGAGVERELAE